MGKYFYFNTWSLLIIVSVLIGDLRRNGSISVFDFTVAGLYLLFWLITLLAYIQEKRKQNEN